MLNLRYSAAYNGVGHRSVFPQSGCSYAHVCFFGTAPNSKGLLFVDTNEQRISVLSFLTCRSTHGFAIGYHAYNSL